MAYIYKNKNTLCIDPKIKAVSTIIISSDKLAGQTVSNFRTSNEIDSLLGVKYSQLKNNIKKLIPSHKLVKAKKIYKHSRVSLGFLFKHITRNGQLNSKFMKIPNGYKIICQVEVPSVSVRRYKNIDIGSTSNGKVEKYDLDLIDTSIRETSEETQLNLRRYMYEYDFQKEWRDFLDLKDLPYHFDYNGVKVFILLL
jgi:hypothetical protein